MEAETAGILEGEGFTAESSRSTRLIDLRYMGQIRALTIELPAMALTRESIDHAVARFREDYEREFKYSLPDATIEAKTLRVSGVGMTGKPSFHASPNGTHQAAVPASRRDVYFAEAGGFVETAVFERTSLRTGDTLVGPALVEQFDGTTVLPPGTRAHVDQFGNLIVTTASA
jgi:N-methylhydantoinase A